MMFFSLVGGPTGQRHEAAEIAQHGFTKFVGKQRRLRLRGIDSRAEQRAERRGTGQPKRVFQSAPGYKRRERGPRDDQYVERGWAFRFRVELPFGRAHAEIARLVNEVDWRAAWGGPPDHRHAKSADEERFGLVLGNVGRSALDAVESRFDITPMP
jgi:hypothetical protein